MILLSDRVDTRSQSKRPQYESEQGAYTNRKLIKDNDRINNQEEVEVYQPALKKKNLTAPSIFENTQKSAKTDYQSVNDGQVIQKKYPFDGMGSDDGTSNVGPFGFKNNLVASKKDENNSDINFAPEESVQANIQMMDLRDQKIQTAK